MAQKVFTWRLRVLPYHYTAFFDSHTYGCSVMRPLFFLFPGDGSTYYNNYQWMLGDALLVAPILSQGTSTLSAYFPQGVWYNLYNYSAIDTSSGGQNITVQVCLHCHSGAAVSAVHCAALACRSQICSFLHCMCGD